MLNAVHASSTEQNNTVNNRALQLQLKSVHCVNVLFFGHVKAQAVRQLVS